MKFNRLTAIVPVLAALAVPGTAAAAATATSSAADGMRYTGTSAADNPRITLAGTTFTIDDSGPIAAGAGCAPVAGDATKVTCVAFKKGSQLLRFEVQLGDGNDSVKNLSTAPMFANGSSGGDTVDGGAPADELRGGSGVDLLRGSGGSDDLDGGAGDDGLFGNGNIDKLHGASGDDFLDGGDSDDQLDGGLGADHIDGGAAGISPGERHDRVLYSDRSAPLKVDLGRTSAQPEAEGDTIIDVEDVVGGDGNDVLTGNAENNLMFGGDGNDSLIGERGLDVLIGGAGADGLFASPSDGFLGIVPDGVADILDCSGPGESVDPGDFAFRELVDGDLVNKCAQVFDA